MGQSENTFTCLTGDRQISLLEINTLCRLSFAGICMAPVTVLSVTVFLFQRVRSVLFLQLENQSTKTSGSKSVKSLRCLIFVVWSWVTECLLVRKEIHYT